MVDASSDKGESVVLVMVAREPQRDWRKVTRKVDVVGVRMVSMS